MDIINGTVLALSNKDVRQIAEAFIEFSSLEDFKQLHGLSFEDNEWIATSVEIKQKQKSPHKWHCHGHGKTPRAAVVNMLKQIKKAYKQNII